MHSSFWFITVLSIINQAILTKEQSEQESPKWPATLVLFLLTLASIAGLFILRRILTKDMRYIHYRVLLNIFAFILYASSLGLVLDEIDYSDMRLYVLVSWIIASIIFLSLMFNSLIIKKSK